VPLWFKILLICKISYRCWYNNTNQTSETLFLYFFNMIFSNNSTENTPGTSKYTKYGFALLLFIVLFFSQEAISQIVTRFSTDTETLVAKEPAIFPADMLSDDYLPQLKGKRVALLANNTAMVGDVHLLDFLLKNKINVVRIFAPEHGFRGDVDRGKSFGSYTDEKTGIRVEQMFGLDRKPTAEQVLDIDIVVFDIQDVGVRFYTYISSMHVMMDACAQFGVEFMVLDRPNPLGDYVDGPIRQESQKSFLGMHPIPLVHGLTVGELALMINGEGWLECGKPCLLTVINAKNYTHSRLWSLPVKPSPNLPNEVSVRLYPSLCLFESTHVSIGRGTDIPFQIIGYPEEKFGTFTFVPQDKPGMQLNPEHEGKTCYGIDLRNVSVSETKFTLRYFLEFADKFPRRAAMITNKRWFNLLVGNEQLYKQITSGMSEADIRKTWQTDLDKYKIMRKKYLLYPDFE